MQYRPACRRLFSGFDEQGGHRKVHLPLVRLEEITETCGYSLKTKTRFCPEKRTSFSCPSSPSRTASYSDFAWRSSQRPSLSATTCLPLCTEALVPSISNRYSPAFRSALPTLEACGMLIVLLIGFANTGTASAMGSSNAALRTNELDFMCVNFLSIGIESAAGAPAAARLDGVDTRARGRVAFPKRHLLFLD